jgi:hypothetical protein
MVLLSKVPIKPTWVFTGPSKKIPAVELLCRMRMRPFTSSLKAGASVPIPTFCPKEIDAPNRGIKNRTALFMIIFFKKFMQKIK